MAITTNTSKSALDLEIERIEREYARDMLAIGRRARQARAEIDGQIARIDALMLKVDRMRHASAS